MEDETERERSPATSVVLLECGRTLIFNAPAPKTGERVWCFRHSEYTRVKSGSAELRVRCADCRYSRPYGVAIETAHASAARHRKRNPSHTVRVMRGAEVVKEYAPLNSQEDALPDAIPF